MLRSASVEIGKVGGFSGDSRRLIFCIATTLAVRLRFKPVAALWRLPACFFDGLVFLFELIGLSVGFSLSMGVVFAFWDGWNFNKDRPFPLA
jgi:hypothetical protein